MRLPHARLHSSFLLAVACFLPATALADSSLTYTGASGGQGMRIMVAGDRVRMDSDGGSSTIFDLSERSMTAVDHGSKRYHVLDEATAERLQAKMDEARAQMERQLAQVPEAQRAMMQQMMQKAMGAAAADVPKDIRVEATGATDTVAGHECRVFRTTADGESMGTSCVAEPAEVGMSGGDYDTMQDAFRFAVDFAMAIAQSAPVPIEMDIQLAEMAGVPVRMEEGDGRVLTLSEVSDADIPSSEMEPPADYERGEMEF